MLFTINRDTFKDALTSIQKVAQAKNAPLFGVAGNVLLEATSREVIISATDLEIGIRLRLPAEVKKSGTICLPVDILTQLASVLPADSTILVKDNTKTRIATLECGGNKTNIKGFKGDEFPDLPEFDSYALQIPVSEMRHLIACTVFATAPDTNRPVLTGVNFQLAETGLTMAAADGYRLAVVRTDTITGDFSTIIPARALAALDKGLATLTEEDDHASVEIAYDAASGRIGFQFPGYEMIVTQIDGKFPDYDQIIPKQFETYAVVETAQLQNALAIQKPFAKDAAWATRIRVTDGLMNISSVSQEKGDTDSQLDAHVEGNPIDISFNLTYLIGGIAAIQTDEVMFRFVSSSAPVVITPQEHENFIYVVMPMSGPATAPKPQEKQEDLQPDEDTPAEALEAVEA